MQSLNINGSRPIYNIMVLRKKNIYNCQTAERKLKVRYKNAKEMQNSSKFLHIRAIIVYSSYINVQAECQQKNILEFASATI